MDTHSLQTPPSLRRSQFGYQNAAQQARISKLEGVKITGAEKLMKQDTMSAVKNKPGESTKKENTSTGMSDRGMPVTERKLYLEKECKILTNYINTYLGKVEQLLQENKCLEKEAKQYQEESSAYLSYIRKHKQKCQNLIVTLNDQNHIDLSQVWAQRETLISQYTAKEEEVKSTLTSLETEYSLTIKELEDLEPFKDKVEHTKKIEELEKKLLVAKIQHADEMHKVRSGFQQAKADGELQLHQKMQALTTRAEEAAMQALLQHVAEVRAENWQLRRELRRLIQHAAALREAKAELREQQQQLQRELRCVRDVAQRRRRLQQQTTQP